MKEFSLKDGKILLIRELNKDDAETVLRYLKKVGGETNFLTFGEEGLPYTVDQERVVLRNFQNSKKDFMIGGFINGELVTVGSISGSSKDRLKHKADIGISVLKKYWDIGVGSKMMERLINICKTNKIRKIDLIVYENNDKAISLYEKFGFEKEGLLTRDAFIDGKFYSSYHMGLKLD